MAERPTPSSIAISTLIALYIDPSSPLDHGSTGDSLLYVLQMLVRRPQRLLSTIVQQLPSTVSNTLMETLAAASSSIDGLVDLMLSIQAIDADGELGVYVRKICLGFDQLSFDSMTRLWEVLRQEVENLETDKNHTLVHWPLSPHQKQDLLRLQCLVLDQSVLSQSPEELQVQIQAIIEEEHELPAAHFLKFLQYLQQGAKVAALDALHQYFDYAMIAERKDLRRQVVLHYATVVLAAVHIQFGEEELSEKATDEAIHVAQQSGDPASVAHALSFLHQVSGDTSILQRCAVRALQAKLRHLYAGANLNLAASHQSWESLLDATTDQPSTASLTTVDRPTHIEDLAAPTEVMEILGQTSLVGAGIWDSMGFSGMSALNTEIGLECYGQFLTSEVKASAAQNLARKALYGPLILPNPDGLCRYGLALRIVVNQGNYAHGTVLLLLEWAIRRGEYGHAHTLQNYLSSRLHARIPNQKDLKTQLAVQEAFLLARKGWVVEAKTKLQKLIDQSRKGKQIVQHSRLLLQLAVTQLEANHQEFRGAVQSVRECLKLCMDNSHDLMHATAMSIMAQIHYRMSEIDTAAAILNGVLPTLLQNGHVWYIGEAFLSLAKCKLKSELHESAVDNLNKAEIYFMECQDRVRLREVYYWQARLYNASNQTSETEEASRLFVHISQQLAKGLLATGLGDIDKSDYLEQMAQRKV